MFLQLLISVFLYNNCSELFALVSHGRSFSFITMEPNKQKNTTENLRNGKQRTDQSLALKGKPTSVAAVSARATDQLLSTS